ncbi:hypothetical protein CHIBA101_2082 [Actinomyces sp. Chiba101]|uniref:hypothetical protein n=1 Tax=Actinomyces denticolens TaxID=52767 RepID=UPI000974E811|nr:hypothetical protein [Actinomyces denticolens]BAW93911.1 hypothetical protein CHIBA101_2082 [Actinomyces sp. Chiba101]GAV93385.1 hypothetical protein ADENT20671_0128 [Actinomyces denticolens]
MATASAASSPIAPAAPPSGRASATASADRTIVGPGSASAPGADPDAGRAAASAAEGIGWGAWPRQEP